MCTDPCKISMHVFVFGPFGKNISVSVTIGKLSVLWDIIGFKDIHPSGSTLAQS